MIETHQGLWLTLTRDYDWHSTGIMIDTHQGLWLTLTGEEDFPIKFSAIEPYLSGAKWSLLSTSFTRFCIGRFGMWHAERYSLVTIISGEGITVLDKDWKYNCIYFQCSYRTTTKYPIDLSHSSESYVQFLALFQDYLHSAYYGISRGCWIYSCLNYETKFKFSTLEILPFAFWYPPQSTWDPEMQETLQWFLYTFDRLASPSPYQISLLFKD